MNFGLKFKFLIQLGGFVGPSVVVKLENKVKILKLRLMDKYNIKFLDFIKYLGLYLLSLWGSFNKIAIKVVQTLDFFKY